MQGGVVWLTEGVVLKVSAEREPQLVVAVTVRPAIARRHLLRLALAPTLPAAFAFALALGFLLRG